MCKIDNTDKKVKVNNTELTVREGGFREGQPCVLIDDVARVHKVTIKYLNRNIRNNIDMFDKDDMIDLLVEDPEFCKEYLNDNNRRKDLYLFSEKGYIKLVSIMKNSKIKKEIMNEFIENYFIMRQHLTNVATLDMNTFIKALPMMHVETFKKYIRNMLSADNIQMLVPAIIEKLRSISTQTDFGHDGMPARKKTAILSEFSNSLKHIMEDNKDTLMGFDREKMLYYDAKIKDYKDTIKNTSLAAQVKNNNDLKKKLNDTQKLLDKTIEEKSIIEKPVANEENKYEDLLRSFKVYRNYLAKVWDMGMEEVCNDYYDLIPVKLPMAKDCIKQGYLSKFEYCYAHYPEDTKVMVNKMYKDCICNGYLERKVNNKENK